MKVMKIICSTLFVNIILSGIAIADAPAEGLVIEGLSVPGVALGDSRAQVNAVYGPALFCQSTSVAGNQGACSYPVAQGGQVDVVFENENGGSASASDSDQASIIRWSEAVAAWVTTANINTSIGQNSPESVISAYPNAVVYESDFFGIARVVDYELGIEMTRSMDFYSGRIHVSMGIFNPRPAPEIGDNGGEGDSEEPDSGGKGKGKGKNGKGKK